MAEYIDDSILDPNEYDHVVFDDGKIYTYNSDSESDEDVYVSVEDWIMQNDDVLRDTYNDLKMFELGNYATYSDFCEYMHYGSLCGRSNIDDWEAQAETFGTKLYGIPKSTMKEFAAHYYYDILIMYRFIERNTELCVGPVEDFITYLYDYSEHNLI